MCTEHLLTAEVGTHLTARTDHSVVHAGAVFILFGGQLAAAGSKTDEVWWLSSDRMEWHLQQTFGEVPGPRAGHCAIFDAAEHRCFAPS